MEEGSPVTPTLQSETHAAKVNAFPALHRRCCPRVTPHRPRQIKTISAQPTTTTITRSVRRSHIKLCLPTRQQAKEQGHVTVSQTSRQSCICGPGSVVCISPAARLSRGQAREQLCRLNGLSLKHQATQLQPFADFHPSPTDNDIERTKGLCTSLDVDGAPSVPLQLLCRGVGSHSMCQQRRTWIHHVAGSR